MKNFSLKPFALLAAMLCATGAFAANASKASVTTHINEINQHGNSWLAIKPSTFSSKGFSISDIVTVKIGNTKINMPICKEYSDVNAGEYLLRLTDDGVCLAINMGNFAKSVDAAEGTSVTITMKQQYGYLTQYHSHLLKSTDSRADYASDEVFANFRGVALGSIASGTLYRSSSPIEPEARAPYAAQLAQAAGVQAVINLANGADDAAKLSSGVPFYSSLISRGSAVCTEMGVSYTDEEFAAQLRDILAFMAGTEGPYLIHGKEGKNRTGTVVAIIEALCGASLDEITDDYMESYVNYHGISKGSTQYAELSKSVQALFDTLAGGKKVTDKTLQKTVERYLLQSVGLTQQQVDAVKAHLQ